MLISYNPRILKQLYKRYYNYLHEAVDPTIIEELFIILQFSKSYLLGWC